MTELPCKALAMYQPPRPGEAHGHWEVSCPFCPRTHKHAADKPDRPGWRIAHCGKGPGYYLIPKADGLPSGG
jgi:hypothetical protein